MRSLTSYRGEALVRIEAEADQARRKLTRGLDLEGNPLTAMLKIIEAMKWVESDRKAPLALLRDAEEAEAIVAMSAGLVAIELAAGTANSAIRAAETKEAMDPAVSDFIEVAKEEARPRLDAQAQAQAPAEDAGP